MYNKVKKCLESMVYDFTECECVELNNGIKLGTGFYVEKNYLNRVYVEICEDGSINVWEPTTCSYLYTINKKETYVMMFELAWCLNN